MTGRQTEFSLSVAVCAWCRPAERGTGLGVVSHGICLRHLRHLKLETQGLLPKPKRRSSSRRDTPEDHQEIFLPL